MRALSYKNGIVGIGCILLFFIGCKRRTSPVDVRDQLKHAMLSYLQKRPNYDSTKVKYEVKDVTFFEDSTYFICNFNVRMILLSQGIDTVGIMAGTVSKDFSVVHRKQ